jgi:hypothetical protein
MARRHLEHGKAVQRHELAAFSHEWISWLHDEFGRLRTALLARASTIKGFASGGVKAWGDVEIGWRWEWAVGA